ncbi:TPA: hypothetical protein DCP88_01165 [Candidatus Campbellbacteria bacterium]|nr:hypothetical protein [Candidatus Campbellbacteria bacterium]
MGKTATVKTEEPTKRVTLDSLRLKAYPHFIKIVEKKALDQIDPEIRKKITAVIGITNVGVDMLLSYGIASTLNEERKAVSEDFLHCRAIYYKMIDSLWVKYLQIEIGIKPPQKHDFVLFVHCCFDKMIPSEMERLAKKDKEFQQEKLREFSFSEYLEKEKSRLQMFKVSHRMEINHSIILPAPREEYIDFMLSK